MSEKDFESFRPVHPDFMDFHELRRYKFSGQRRNSIDGSIEIWIDGEIKRVVSAIELELNPETALAKALEEVFLFDSDVQFTENGNATIIH